MTIDIGQKSEGVLLDNITITISGRRGRVFSRHDNNDIGQKREGVFKT